MNKSLNISLPKDLAPILNDETEGDKFEKKN